MFLCKSEKETEDAKKHIPIDEHRKSPEKKNTPTKKRNLSHEVRVHKKHKFESKDKLDLEIKGLKMDKTKKKSAHFV